MKNVKLMLTLLIVFAIPSFGQAVTGPMKDAIDLPMTKIQNINLQLDAAKAQVQAYTDTLHKQYEEQKTLYDQAVLAAQTALKVDPAKNTFDNTTFTFKPIPAPSAPAPSQIPSPPSPPQGSTVVKPTLPKGI